MSSNSISSLKTTQRGQTLLRELDNLSLTHPDEFRERLGALKHKYQRSEQQLQELVSSHQTELRRAMQIYENVSGRITATRARMRTVRENLVNCKMLLHCKRDELKKLWQEGMEHKHMLSILESVEELRGLPDAVGVHVQRREFYRATRRLTAGVAQLDGQLAGIQALQEVRAELETLADGLHERLTDELQRHLYQQSTQAALAALSRHGSGRGSGRVGSERGDEQRSSGRSSARDRERRPLLDISGLLGGPAGGEEELEALDGGDGPSHPAVLVECLTQLQKLPDTVEAVLSRMEAELLSVVTRTSQLLLEQRAVQVVAPVIGPSLVQPADGPALLAQLLDAVSDQFRAVAATHERVLAAFRRAAASRGLDTIVLYSMDDVWARIQDVLKLVTSEYLDVQRTGTGAETPLTPRSETVAELSSHFVRKRPQRVRTRQLFNFDASSTSLNMGAYLQEKARLERQRVEGGAVALLHSPAERALLVPADPLNITILYPPLMRLAAEIEEKLGQSSHCPLHAFINDYIGEVLLGQLRAEGALLAETRMDGWKTLQEPTELAQLGAAKPLLQSAVQVRHFVASLRTLMTSLPDYCNHFLSIICGVLVQYKEACGSQYRGVTQAEDGRTVVSAQWAHDDDISRFLRELPNWLNQKQGGAAAAAAAGAEDLSVEESPEEVRERNRRETEILSGNLGDGDIGPGETIADVQLLRQLAWLHESLEWLGGYVQNMAAALAESGAVPESSAQTLTQLGRDLEELADSSLLVLHLEVRVHCFFHLLPLTRQGQFAPNLDSSEPDPEVMRLNRDLAAIMEALQSALRKRKLRYIFEGLAPLVSNLLISAVTHITRINENGVKKMVRDILSLQQSMTNLTMAREVALDHARTYYELLLKDSDEVLAGVTERGAAFAEAEYAAALELLHRSQPGAPAMKLHNTLERLADVMSGALAAGAQHAFPPE
ncbi:exocyst complex component 4-like [Pollicipes pollicipes]|uniref:exocyst complex component 4-like n=1 Tax=Pollicipes pollicipes TaxID=41117 RepID=UPI00188559CE|nr:exocyst complex component 4-like [Pollicipes pollicipes]